MTVTQRIARPLAATAALALLVTGCGGDGGGRPSVEEISDSLQSGDLADAGMNADVADCIAEAFHDSDLSDEALQAIVDQDEDYEPSEEDEQAADSIESDAMSECIAEGMDLPDMEDLETPEAS